MAKYIAEIVLAGSRILGRAFAKAIREEYVSSQQAAKARSSSRSNDSSRSSETGTFSGISLEEAKQILNVQDINDTETLLKKYDHLFSVNDKAKGGSLYLQSKVFRAKERIDEELQKSKKPPEPTDDTTTAEQPNSPHL